MSNSRNRQRKARRAALPVLDLDAFRDRIEGLEYSVGGGGMVIFTVPMERPRRWWQFWRRRRECCHQLLFGAPLSIDQLERWAMQLNRPSCTSIQAPFPQPMRVVFRDPRVRWALRCEVLACWTGFCVVTQLPLRLKDACEQAAAFTGMM